MSNRNPEQEPTSRRSSRRTQRYRQSVEQPNKRLLLKVFGAGTLAAVTGGLTWGISQRKAPAVLTPDQPRAEELSDEVLYYHAQLGALNSEILKNPNSFKEIAPKVGHLAVQYFCKEMGYDPIFYQDKLIYQWEEEYLKTREETSGCVDTTTPEDEYGRTNVLYNEVYFNISRVLYEDRHQRKLAPLPAPLLFIFVIHELLHTSAPFIRGEGPNEPDRRGLGLLIPVSERFSKPGLVCYRAQRVQLEEAIVNDATEKLVAKLHLPHPELPDDVKFWVSTYRNAVLDSFFNGDYKPLLMLHQHSKQDEFFNLIGEKLGSPSYEALEAGEGYLHSLLVRR